MSEAKVLTGEKLLGLLPLSQFMTVRMSRSSSIINIDTDTQPGLILDMGIAGTRPSGVAGSGNMIFNLILNESIRYQLWFAWQGTPKILVRSVANAGRWSAWYPMTLGAPLSS